MGVRKVGFDCMYAFLYKVNEVTMEMDSASEFVEYCMRDEDWTEKVGNL